MDQALWSVFWLGSQSAGLIGLRVPKLRGWLLRQQKCFVLRFIFVYDIGERMTRSQNLNQQNNSTYWTDLKYFTNYTIGHSWMDIGHIQSHWMSTSPVTLSQFDLSKPMLKMILIISSFSLRDDSQCHLSNLVIIHSLVISSILYILCLEHKLV